MNTVSTWKLVEEKFDIKNNLKNETLFALANGYLGLRGNFEEGLTNAQTQSVNGTYLNGFYESEMIQYGEKFVGYADLSQTMLNVTNAKIVKLIVDGEAFDLNQSEVTEYERYLDFQHGVLFRKATWKLQNGKEVLVQSERIVSFTRKHLAVVKYAVTPLNFDGEIEIISLVDGDVHNIVSEDDPRVGSGFTGRVLHVEDSTLKGNIAAVLQETETSRLSLSCAILNDLVTDSAFTTDAIKLELVMGHYFKIQAEKNKQITLYKYMAYFQTKDYAKNELIKWAVLEVNEGQRRGFEGIQKEQKSFLDDFWKNAGVEIKGDDIIQQGVRYAMFQLLQSVGRDGKTNICAKGLTGEGYEGHTFWDTEMYIFPFFLYTKPEIARALLLYRYNKLDKARERARQMGHPVGALFPWRTIDGEECSSYYPAGSAQYHINSGVAHAFKSYIIATDDEEFIKKYAAEVLFETARFWINIGDYIPKKGNKFCINEVTGPDEYTTLVNNNCFTNLGARENLLYAYEIAQWMQDNAGKEWEGLVSKMGLKDEEPDNWKKAGENMYVPYDEEMKIYPQDDNFLEKQIWDFENTPKENYPLLLHYHPLVIGRYQVCKQADLVLAQFSQGDYFDLEQKKRDYDYYEKITTHDSSLSTCIFSIMGSEVGYFKKSYDYFLKSVRLDLDDYKGNTKDGIHAANMGGAWMCITFGFAGMRIVNNSLHFNPHLPQGWELLSFLLRFKGRLLQVILSKDKTEYRLLEGEPLEIFENENAIKLG